MVDYAKLRKKFPAKKKLTVSHHAEIEAVRREFAQKRAEMGGFKPPVFKKGVVFYGVVLIGLLIVGSLVLSATGKGGRAPISKALLQAHKSVDALAVALGRYRYHVGEYPTTEQGLAFLASDKVRKPGWNGPYIRQLVKDPWGQDYVYVSNGNNMVPTLYSKGPDRQAGTTDDILPTAELFDLPFRDTSWTREWMPYRYRGYVLAPDEETKSAIEAQVKELRRETIAEDDARRSETRPDNAALLAQAVRLHEAVKAKELTRPVRLLSGWTFKGFEGKLISIACETRGDKVLYYVNNTLAGEGKCINAPRFVGAIPYEPGELKVIAFEDGAPIGEDSVKTGHDARQLQLIPDQSAMRDGECQFVQVVATDDDGVRLPEPPMDIKFTLEGTGEIVAVGTYSPTGERLSFGDTKTILSTGGTVALIRRAPGSGKPLLLRAHTKGGVLRPAQLTIPWQP